MERLTNKNHKEVGFCAYIGAQNPFKTPLTIGELAGCINIDYSPRKILEDILGRLAAYEDTMSLDRAQELAQAEKDGRLTILPPNDPLTLEEMRGMDGEPVWIVGADDAEIEQNGYAVEDFHIWGRENAPVIFWFGNATEDEPSTENYGKTWRAYRRRPEEGTV